MQRIKPPKIIQNSNVNVPQPRGMLEQWFPQWWGWYSKTSNTNTQSTSSTFDGELLDVLADTIDVTLYYVEIQYLDSLILLCLKALFLFVL